MKKKDRPHQEKPAVRSTGVGEHQTDLAEGELDTVEESILIHERKGDLPSSEPSQKHGKTEKK